MSVKPRDVKAGKTFYVVRAFPHRPGSSYLETVLIVDRPYETDVCWFVKIKRWSDVFGKCFETSISLMDAGIIPNTYNFHKTFTSRKAALRYMKRIDTGCLTMQEKLWARAQIEIDKMFDDFFDAMHEIYPMDDMIEVSC